MLGLETRSSWPLTSIVVYSFAAAMADQSMTDRPVLVAPDSFKGTFRATEVAAAIGRGLESAGLAPPDLCPVADGGEGTMEVLLTALGGETAARARPRPARARGRRGLRADRGRRHGGRRDGAGQRAGAAWSPTSATRVAASTRGTGELIAAAVADGAQVVLVACGGSATTDGAAGAIEAIEEAGGLRGAKIVVPVRRAHAVRARRRGLRPAEGRRPGDRQAADQAAERLRRRRCRATRAASR